MRIFATYLAVLFFIPILAWSATDTSRNTAAEVNMALSLRIPTYIYLRIGSAGSVTDTVTFQLQTAPEGQIQMVRGFPDPQVQVWTNAKEGVLFTADSSEPMRGSIQKIPFSAISFRGTGDFSGAQRNFDTTANQLIGSFAKGNYRGTFQYYFRFTYQYLPGIYYGTVTYTVSTP